MKLKKSVKIGLIIIVVLALVVGGYFVYKNFKSGFKQEVKVLNKIEGYDYELLSGETKLYQNFFKELKANLDQEQRDEKEYANSIAKMFAVDFYNIDNKISKNDVGGVEFVYKDKRSMFIDKAQDTVYAYIDNNLNGDREQELPVVKAVEVISNTNITYSYNSKKSSDDKAYDVKLKLTYEKDMGYPTSLEVILIHVDNVLYVAEIK